MGFFSADHVVNEEVYNPAHVVRVAVTGGLEYDVEPGTFVEKDITVPPEIPGGRPEKMKMFFFEHAYEEGTIIGRSKDIVTMTLRPPETD